MILKKLLTYLIKIRFGAVIITKRIKTLKINEFLF